MDGLFISKDPIGFAGGDVNLYGYVGNSSPNFTDPSGLCVEDACIVEGTIAAAAACARNPSCSRAVTAGLAAIGTAISALGQKLCKGSQDADKWTEKDARDKGYLPWDEVRNGTPHFRPGPKDAPRLPPGDWVLVPSGNGAGKNPGFH